MKWLFFCLLSVNLLALEVSEKNGVIIIEEIPHVLQKPDFCGEACVEMTLKAGGFTGTQDDIFNASGLAPEKGRGCYAPDLYRGLKKMGVDPGVGWYQITANSSKGLDALWTKILKKLKSGVPTIVCSRFSDKPNTTEHFRLIVGFDSNSREIIYHEPALKDSSYLRMKLSYFKKIWPLKYRKDKWTVILFHLPFKQQPKFTKYEGYTPSDYAQHVLKLREKLPDGFSVVVQKPFVVIGNNHENIVRKYSTNIVKWTVDRIKKQYFKKDPAEILDIWLFKDKKSYEFYNKKLWGTSPGTPYGYYSSRNKVLVMNIATGGGTLVHEIVHPYMEANFKDCPAWFNEGLASLYEQSSDNKGRIKGLTNWRLTGLKKAINTKELPSFKELCSTSDNQFYHGSRGDNYAQARYLCYYLQKKGVLEEYYRKFSANSKNDPTGYETLKEVLKEDDMGAFQKRWEAWVLTLRR